MDFASENYIIVAEGVQRRHFESVVGGVIAEYKR